MKEERLLAVESLAFVNSANAAQAMIEVASKGTDVAKTAKYWAQRQGTAEWAKFGIEEALKQGGVYDPDKVVNTSVTVPEESKERKVNVADVMKLTGDAATGKATIMRCVMCHQVNGIGPDYGPALKGWGTAQAREAIIKSIVEPSADIRMVSQEQKSCLPTEKSFMVCSPLEIQPASRAPEERPSFCQRKRYRSNRQ